LRIDAMLAEQGTLPLDLAGELLASLGHNRQRRVPGGPLLVPCGLAGQQFLLPVTQRRGLLILLGSGVRSDAHPLIDGGQLALDRGQPALDRPSCSDSRSDSSSTFLDLGVNGMTSDGTCWPWPMISTTCARTACRLIPSDSSALAATPSPSWMRPSSMCSVPIQS
jgi:hypothetical protein